MNKSKSGRYDKFLGVRTAKGEIGYVPLSSVVFLKDQPGAKPALKPAPPVTRERMAYDEKPPQPTRPVPSPNDFTLLNNTPVRLKLAKTISSAAAHVGNAVELEVVEDVSVNGVIVIAKGTTAAAVVSEAESKKRMGRAGKLGITFKSAKLVNGETVPIRGYQEVGGTAGASSTSINPLASGKDAAFLPGTEFTALVDGNLHLSRDAFENTKPRDPIATSANPAAPKSPEVIKPLGSASPRQRFPLSAESLPAYSTPSPPAFRPRLPQRTPLPRQKPVSSPSAAPERDTRAASPPLAAETRSCFRW
jgi:hypothetical protein